MKSERKRRKKNRNTTNIHARPLSKTTNLDSTHAYNTHSHSPQIVRSLKQRNKKITRKLRHLNRSIAKSQHKTHITHTHTYLPYTCTHRQIPY